MHEKACQSVASQTSTTFAPCRHLRTCHGKDAVAALMFALARDADAKVRQWAADTLGMLRDASARPALETAARDDKDKDVRQLAADALKKLP